MLISLAPHPGADSEGLVDLTVAVRADTFGNWHAGSTLGPRVKASRPTARPRSTAATAAEEEPSVIWLGYKGLVHQPVEAGRVCFYDALSAVPNAESGRLEFSNWAELWDLVQNGHTFRVAKWDDEAVPTGASWTGGRPRPHGTGYEARRVVPALVETRGAVDHCGYLLNIASTSSGSSLRMRPHRYTGRTPSAIRRRMVFTLTPIRAAAVGNDS